MLRLGDHPTIVRLKLSIGGVPGLVWSRLKNLPTRQAIVRVRGIDPALIVVLDPTPCKLPMVD
jgi:hypothetical protein